RAGRPGSPAGAAQLVASGWARPLTADRDTVRACAPRIRTVGDELLARDEAARAARLPSLAWETVRDGLKTGPVLVQVPRRGYVPRLACERCRTPARCRACAGPLEAPDARDLTCGWCGRPEPSWHCEECGSFRLRAQVVGARRTAEELGRAFPAVPVRTSGRDHVLDEVPDRPALVVSTPGAEPVAAGDGYAAALLLDGWAMLTRPDLRAGEEALRRWIAAASLVRGEGQVVVVAEPTLRPVQALVRWDPVGHAVRELAERAELGFPPVSRMAAVVGRGEAVESFLADAALPADAEVLGPVPLPGRRGEPSPGERALVRVPPGSGAALAAALKAAQAARMARGVSAAEAVRVRIDPLDIG
ncbi:primosome assembly protein PriA, partial [Streptomyces sp. NPDC004050]